jgi:hypothetical protein
LNLNISISGSWHSIRTGRTAIYHFNLLRVELTMVCLRFVGDVLILN